jgi:hypothetical protein
MIKRFGAAAIVLAAAALAGCSTGTPPGGAPGPTGSSAVLGSAPPSATTTAEPILPDGRSPVLLTAIDVPGRTITFDLVELYLGTDAAVQWKKDHPGQPVPALNGHYMRNNNPKLRTLPVAADVVIHVIPGGDPDHPDTLPFADLPTYEMLNGPPYWITVKNGTITMIEQQFIP